MSDRQTRRDVLASVMVGAAATVAAGRLNPSLADTASPGVPSPSRIQLGAQSLAFIQSAGTGRPIVLVHGNSCSSKAWRKQFEGPLATKHRLIAIDLPGHGDSGRAPAPETDYTTIGYSRVLAEFADKMGLKNAIFVGWSLGGHTVLEAASDLPMAAGLMIFGTPPISKAKDGFAGFKGLLPAAFNPAPTDTEIDAFVANLFAPHFSPIPPFFAADFRRADGAARACLGASAQNGTFKDEVVIIGKELKIPLAIACGQEEQIVDLNYLKRLKAPSLWLRDVQVVADAGHAIQWERAKAFDELLDEFASSV
jgi:pimeloyl-ACP methyl ester carboxylesterase